MSDNHNLPYALYRAEQVREFDRIAIEEFAIPGYTLMCRAGTAVLAALRERWPQARRIAVLCGMGNNGGDGFVVARLARAAGLEATVLQMGDSARLRGDARTAADSLLNNGGTIQAFQPELLQGADVLVDALLGTGLEREVSGAWRAAIEALNQHPAPKLAVDIPSGLHSDTGTVMGIAVQAELTVTFIALKQGMFTGQGAQCCGTIFFDDLEVPPQIYGHQILAARRLTWEKLQYLLGRRPRTAHKGDYGHVLVVGGELGFSGAARMAAEAAARVGAGLVSVATRATHALFLNNDRPELMCHGIEQAAELAPLLSKANVVAIGPGLGRSPWSRELLAAVLATDLPLVVDADALNLLAEQPLARDGWIITPHPGEASRLLQCPTGEIQQDRFAAVQELQRRYGGVCVLKGSGSLVQTGGKPVAVCHAGNPGMASGGMGDVLTGVIAGLLAQGLSPEDAACAGVCLHSTAADQAAANGERGMLAVDLMAPLRRLLNP